MAKKINNVVLGYELMNEEKLERSINGTVTQHGEMVGGVGEKGTPEQIIAEYDRLGGYIKKGKYKVKTGSFYDFDEGAPRETPDVVFLFRVNDEVVEIPEGEAIPLEVQASEVQRERAEERQREKIDEAEEKKAAKKAKGKKKLATEGEEEVNE